MIVIRVLLQVQPANRQAFLDFMHESITISNEFEGCEKYHVYQDVQDENTFLLYEEWTTQAQFDIYRESDHFKHSGDVLFPMMAGKPDSVYFDAQVIQ